MKKFSDFASKSGHNLEGEKMPLEDIFEETIVVCAFRIIQSKFRQERECVQIQFEMDGKKHVTFSTSVVLISQLREYQKELPFETVIKRQGKYFTFT